MKGADWLTGSVMDSPDSVTSPSACDVTVAMTTSFNDLAKVVSTCHANHAPLFVCAPNQAVEQTNKSHGRFLDDSWQILLLFGGLFLVSQSVSQTVDA